MLGSECGLVLVREGMMFDACAVECLDGGRGARIVRALLRILRGWGGKDAPASTRAHVF